MHNYTPMHGLIFIQASSKNTNLFLNQNGLKVMQFFLNKISMENTMCQFSYSFVIFVVYIRTGAWATMPS